MEQEVQVRLRRQKFRFRCGVPGFLCPETFRSDCLLILTEERDHPVQVIPAQKGCEMAAFLTSFQFFRNVRSQIVCLEFQWAIDVFLRRYLKFLQHQILFALLYPDTIVELSENMFLPPDRVIR